MSQIKRNTSKKLLNTIYVPQNKKTPPKQKTPSISMHNMYSSFFVMNCQKAIKAHHQKEVVEETIEHLPNQLVKPEAQQAHPPKSVHALPERS